MPPSFVVVVRHEYERMIYDRVIETLILIFYRLGSRIETDERPDAIAEPLPNRHTSDR